MSDRALKTAARRFLVYRAGASIKWDCTIADLARMCDLSKHTVTKICRSDTFQRKGWVPRGDTKAARRESYVPKMPVDQALSLPAESPLFSIYGC